MRKYFVNFSALSLATTFAIGLLAQSVLDGSPTNRECPNVVLIVTDDQDCGDFGSAGNPPIETQQLDALAAASASVENSYVSPLCSPTRANLMTGRYNCRTRVVDTALGRCLMEPAEITIAELRLDVRPGADSCSFPAVKLVPGPTQLEARLDGGPQPRDANFVTLHHRN